ncbi:Protein of unknown function [Terribacillus aidingensis]|uniref:DUF2812 domain-containing protein n=1 Tax=Terribacillus aidingensis TaxID=586416 RepID=A0A285P329_9BACI|nr:DUF2812 domain-containing protein [Terribacillus aidingensis]SNZ16140.1 Protein of unknown function [Terribacillus aidingensis]
MRQKKYVSSGGLAFSEKQDMRKLSKQAAKGWHLQDFSFMGYRLVRGEPKQVQYMIDYRTLDAAEEQEYIGMFDESGWTLVCNSYGMYIFEASIDTAPIYTDADTKQDKLKRASSFIPKSALIWTMLTVIAYLIMDPADSWIATIICTILLILAICSVAMTLAFYYRTIKLIRKGDD